MLEAERKGLAKYIEFKTKSERGEQIRTLTIEEMAERFLAKQKKRISAIPHNSNPRPANAAVLLKQQLAAPSAAGAFDADSSGSVAFNPYQTP